MYETLQVVRVLERGEHLADHPQVHGAGEGAVAQLLAAADHSLERAPLEVLHRHEVAALLLPDLVGLHDVRVVQAGSEARFVEEHGEERRLLGQVGLQLLDDDDALEAAHPLAGGEIDDAHAPTGELGDQAVFSETVRGSSGHLGNESISL